MVSASCFTMMIGRRLRVCFAAAGRRRKWSVCGMRWRGSMASCERRGASHRKKGGTRHPQVGNCGAPAGASMFTQVNFRRVNKIRQVLSDAISNDDVGLRQVPQSVESRKRVEAQGLV